MEADVVLLPYRRPDTTVLASVFSGLVLFVTRLPHPPGPPASACLSTPSTSGRRMPPQQKTASAA